MKEASEQFVDDYLMVSQNDQATYYDHIGIVASNGVGKGSEILREQFEEWASDLADREEKRGYEVGALFIRQLLIGWGADSFYKIAERFENEGDDISASLNSKENFKIWQA
jgi:hypothetical protein